MVGLGIMRQRVRPGRVIRARHPAARQAHQKADLAAADGLALPTTTRLRLHRHDRV